jgi:ACS family hexuronate transporter-like MFS transporter
VAMLQSLARYRWVILGLAFISQFSSTMAAQVIPPLAPLFQAELGLTKTEVGFFSSATFIGTWVVLLGAGYVTDRFGIRITMSLGQITAGAIMLAMLFTGSFIQAAIVMFIVGVTRGSVLPGATKAVMDWFSPTTRGTAMGIKQTGYPLAGILTAATLPSLALAVGWRYSFAVVGVLIIIAGVVTAILYRDPEHYEQSSARRPGLLEGMRELVRNPQMWVLGFMSILYVTGQLGVVTYLALYFTEVVLVPSIPDEATRIVTAGGYLAVFLAGGAIGRVFWGVISDRFLHGKRMAMLVGIGYISALLSLVVGFVLPGGAQWLMAPVAFALGSTSTGWNGLYHAVVAETAGRKNAGMAVGFCMTMSEGGTVIGPILFGILLDATGTYDSIWLCLFLLCAVGATIASLNIKQESQAK